jgi:hypothetical protein
MKLIDTPFDTPTAIAALAEQMSALALLPRFEKALLGSLSPDECRQEDGCLGPASGSNGFWRERV